MKVQGTDVRVDMAGTPETRPGLHVTPEGRLVGSKAEWEWQGPEDDRTAGLGTMGKSPLEKAREAAAEAARTAGLDDEGPVAMLSPEAHKALKKDMESRFNTPPSHPNERTGTQAISVDGVPMVTTTSTDGTKRTMEHEGNFSVSVDAEGAEVLRRFMERGAEAAMEEAKRKARGGEE